MVHRILKDILLGKNAIQDKYSQIVQVASIQSSEKEKNAEMAERAVDDYYKMLYIENYIGHEFTGYISGVTKFGIFVEIDGGIEGLIKLETLFGKRYKLDAKNYTLSNEKQKFKLGQCVKIKVAGVNVMDGKAEFLFVKDNEK